MGRLFWKFFVAILLAQLAATLAIGGAFWLRNQARATAAAAELDTSPPAEFVIASAAATLRHGGSAALRELILTMRQRSVIAIDDAGQEILGRSVKPELREQAEKLLATGAERQAVGRYRAPDGKRYLIFIPSDGRHGPAGPHAENRGPGGPGGPPPKYGNGPGSERPDMPASAALQLAFGAAPPAIAYGAGTAGASGPAAGQFGPGAPRRDPGPPPDRQYWQIATLLGATLASLLFAALLAWYFARPIRALRSAFDAAAAGDLAPRFGNALHRRGDELTDLGRDFDRMSAQLRTLMEGQRRLLHDVSHELRSPLARMQAAIGLAHQQPDKIDASLERIERESVRMDKLVGELLTLARLEAAAPNAAREDLVLADLVRDIVDEARIEAGLKQQTISISGASGATVHAAPDLLWRAIENVVRNAIKHNAEGASIQVLLSDVDASVQVAVLDRGTGVNEADLIAIFKPFVRSNPSENNVDGHGLGLAIAARVLDAHGGNIYAANRDGGGLAVTISLPRA